MAIDVPTSWRDAAAAIRARTESGLDGEARSALRWVQPERLHLTLRFLGEFPDDALGRLHGALDREVTAVDFALRTARVGAYGDRRGVRVIWVGVDGDIEALSTLARAVERACVAAGAAPERRALVPHVTVARVRERAPLDARHAIASAVADLGEPAQQSMQVREVLLVRSFLGSGPPRYEVLSRHPRAG